jgi:hypothetical protein
VHKVLLRLMKSAARGTRDKRSRLVRLLVIARSVRDEAIQPLDGEEEDWIASLR